MSAERTAWLSATAAELRAYSDRARECWAVAQAAQEFGGSADPERRALGSWLAQAAATVAERLADDLEAFAETATATSGVSK